MQGLIAIDYAEYQLHCYSPISGMHVIDSNPDQCRRLHAWATKEDDRSLQDVVPEMPSHVREQILSGHTKEEWDVLFPDI